MPKTNFWPKSHGFHFTNRFVNRVATVPGFGSIETKGRCGGMSYAALDYYFAGVPIPRYIGSDFPPDLVPPDGHWLADYIYTRQMNSFFNDSAIRFISWTQHSDHETWFFKGVTRWTKEDEFPKLRRAIDSRRPVVLGLIKARSLSDIGDNHQVVAYGYEHESNGTMTVYIYDNAEGDFEVTLTSTSGDPHFHSSTGDTWRGFFVHDYSTNYPPVEPFEQLFPSVHDYATRSGYTGGYPNCHSADYGNGTVYGSVLVKGPEVEFRDIPAAELGHPQSAQDRFRAVNDYAYHNGYLGAFPTFHQADYGSGLVMGTILIRHSAADFQDINLRELGYDWRVLTSSKRRMTKINDYAVARGYVGGFPTFHQANYGDGIVMGAILIKPGHADRQDVSYYNL